MLALIQGITEFLPISSSAHLLLPSLVFGWPDQGLAFDVAVHFGSLVAVLIYFRAELQGLFNGVLKHLIHRESNDDAKFAYFLTVASLPILPAGLLGRYIIEDHLRTTEVIALMTIVFGLVLLLADYVGKKTRSERDLSVSSALLIGVAQCVALIPGTSRSGITISMALLLNFTRSSAARISFLISIPAILGATVLKTFDLLTTVTTIDWFVIGLGAGISAIAAYGTITLFLTYISTLSYMPFMIYRLLLGTFLLVLLV